MTSSVNGCNKQLKWAFLCLCNPLPPSLSLLHRPSRAGSCPGLVTASLVALESGTPKSPSVTCCVTVPLLPRWVLAGGSLCPGLVPALQPVLHLQFLTDQPFPRAPGAEAWLVTPVACKASVANFAQAFVGEISQSRVFGLRVMIVCVRSMQLVLQALTQPFLAPTSPVGSVLWGFLLHCFVLQVVGESKERE